MKPETPHIPATSPIPGPIPDRLRDLHRLRAPLLACLACLFFFLAGLAFLPHLGLEDDESLFAQGLYHPRSELDTLTVGRSHIPIMMMSYLGALKTWIIGPIFRVFGAGTLTLRIPMLLAGTASVWLFFLLLRRISGDRAALIGCALLATDSIYLLTVCFDWGPVALQHLLTVGGMLLLVRFYQQRDGWALAGAFFCFGLALWDKALATWMLGGLGIAAISTLPRQLFATLTWRRIAVALVAFTLGASPLLLYNARHDWGTFHGNFKRDDNRVIAGKATMLKATATGNGLFGWLVDEDWQTPRPHPPQGALARVSAGISAFANHPREHLLYAAFLLALLLAALAARGNDLRAILFVLIAMSVAWVQMAITANAGGSVHHTVLLWPLPEAVVAIALAAASRRLGRAGIPAVAIATAVLAISGALVINEYYYLMLRNGGAQAWDDAIFALSDYLKNPPAPLAAAPKRADGQPPQTVICLDWGILDPLRLLNRGKLALEMGSDPVSKLETSADDRAMAERMISEPGSIFVAHRKEFEFFPGISPKLVDFAARSGYRREMLAVIPDSSGREVFEIYRFQGPGSAAEKPEK